MNHNGSILESSLLFSLVARAGEVGWRVVTVDEQAAQEEWDMDTILETVFDQVCAAIEFQKGKQRRVVIVVPGNGLGLIASFKDTGDEFSAIVRPYLRPEQRDSLEITQPVTP